MNKHKHTLTGDDIIHKKVTDLLDAVMFEKKVIETNYRYFYNRLDALNLIDHSCDDDL